LLFGLSLFPATAHAAFTSLYVFGDGVCTTTNGPGGQYFYSTNGANGKRYTNGRVWIEVLAERQGLTYDANKNWSYYGHYSSNMLINVSNFTALDASTSLFIVWACDADFVGNLINGYGTNITLWTNSVNSSLLNHSTLISNLYYAKGVRTLLMPNAVDLTKVPFYQQYAEANKSFVRDQIIGFNSRFAALLTNAAASLPGLTIYAPDLFTFVNTVTAHPTDYGLIKPQTSAITDLPPAQWALNGPGRDYAFWDDLDPSAKFHAQIADFVQQSFWPVQITNLTLLDDDCRLDLANVPIGRDGYAEHSTNLVDWISGEDFDSTHATQSISVRTAGPQEFYRLRFPFSWTWP